MERSDVIVIGAGWSGLTAASRLAAHGLSVVVLEKSRGPGGRSATRRDGEYSFDHGAQYFTARSDAFQRRVQIWERSGWVAEWRPRLKVFGPRPEATGNSPDRRLVAVPGMNGLLRRFADGLDCRYSTRVVAAHFDGHWQLELGDGARIESSALVVTAPPRQSAALLGIDHPLHGQLADLRMLPCWALMVGFDRSIDVDFDAAFVNQGGLAWLARNSCKPQRPGPECWVVHASAEWSARHLELEPGDVTASMLDGLRELEPAFEAAPRLAQAHRWRFALAESPLSAGCLFDGESRLVVAGDWCSGSRIEGAWASGVAAARVLQALF
jgi:renalase